MIKRRLGYLSGAPRISTHPNSMMPGPRAHVLGVMRAFEALGWEVEHFILGDRIPQQWGTGRFRSGFRRTFYRTLLADLVRPALSAVQARRALREFGEVDWIYERYDVFMAMGRVFKRRGVLWVLEVNAAFCHELRTSTNDFATSDVALPALARWLERRAFDDCDVIVCISETLKEIVVREVGVVPDKVIVMPNAVDTAFYDPILYKPRQLFEGFTIGYVGNVVHGQGLLHLLKALRVLRGEGKEISLVVVGDGMALVELKEQALREGMGKYVAFVGSVERQEVPSYIAGFDVGFSGQIRSRDSDMYRSPLKLYEYMAMGKPVIASSFEDARRLVGDGETGFLFDAADQTDLKRAVARAYEARSALPNMGARAREEVVSHHDWISRVRSLVSELDARFSTPAEPRR
jgi:glycosyltransferase involved in cell wall biosynthesis